MMPLFFKMFKSKLKLACITDLIYIELPLVMSTKLHQASNCSGAPMDLTNVIARSALLIFLQPDW